MTNLKLAAKISHVPSMMLSERPGKFFGIRKAAIDGLTAIGQRCRDLGVKTIVVFDTHWLVNSGYHINANARYHGIYTSNEFPQFIQDMAYDYHGAANLGDDIAARANAKNVRTMAHHVATLELEYGTLVPMHFINKDKHFNVLSIAAWCAWHDFDDSRRLGEAVREAIEASGEPTAIFASGSLSHRIHDTNAAIDGINSISNEYYRQVDEHVVELWQRGEISTFIDMLPLYATTCHGEGLMHDTAMLLGALGWHNYKGKAEIITDYFASSGTGQINAVFPISS